MNRGSGEGLKRAKALEAAKLEATGVYYMHAPIPENPYSRQLFRAAGREADESSRRGRMAMEKRRCDRQDAGPERLRTCVNLIAKRSVLKDRFPQTPGHYANGSKHAWQRGERGAERKVAEAWSAKQIMQQRKRRSARA